MTMGIEGTGSVMDYAKFVGFIKKWVWEHIGNCFTHAKTRFCKQEMIDHFKKFMMSL